MKDKILQRYERHADRIGQLLRELEAFDEAALNRRPANGGWSALQTAHHLLLAEERSLLYIHKKLSGPAQFDPVGAGVRGRALLLWISLRLPIKFKSPPAVDPENLPEQSTLADVRTRWQEIGEGWRAFFAGMPDELGDKAVYRHPRAGRLGWMQTLNFFETHLARHRGQIRRALGQEGS